MHKLFASAHAHANSAAQLLQLFAKLLALQGLTDSWPQSSRRFYRRAWCPLITLWYLIWQRLSPQHSLAAVVADARRGGADALRPQRKPLSARLRSSATTAFAKARARLPLVWVQQCFQSLAASLAALAQGIQAPDALPVRLLDGSTLRLRPHGDIPKEFPPHRTRRQKAYWCVVRTVVCFCGASAVALGAQLGSIQASEQTLAVRLILAAAARALYVGDRNFGVWRIVRACAQAGGHALVRLTGARAGRLAAGRRLKAGLDLAVTWEPTRHDQVDRGLKKQAVAGRLVVVRVARRGWRTQTLVLFTTLTDARAYPPSWLLAGGVAPAHAQSDDGPGSTGGEIGGPGAQGILRGTDGLQSGARADGRGGADPRRRRGILVVCEGARDFVRGAGAAGAGLGAGAAALGRSWSGCARKWAGRGSRAAKSRGRRSRGRSITSRKCSRRCGARAPRPGRNSRKWRANVSGIGLQICATNARHF